MGAVAKCPLRNRMATSRVTVFTSRGANDLQKSGEPLYIRWACADAVALGDGVPARVVRRTILVT